MATTRLETRLTARDETGRAFRTLNSSLSTATTAFTRVTAVAAGLGAVFSGIFIRDLVSVNKEFQSLKASLITFTGSVENADGAFKILQNFAKSTPFSLQEVVGSFNLLVAQGIRPTEKQLMSFADIAGGTSKSIMQFAEAVADASVGEFERLKEFGIKASKEGDNVTLKIGDMTKTVKNDSASLVAALTEIADVKFGGGAARQADTLGGAMTNLRDTVDSFLFTIGESGFAGELTKAIKLITSMISGNDELAKTISGTLTSALYIAVAGVAWVIDNLKQLMMVFKIVFGVLVIRKILTTAKAIYEFARAVAKAEIVVSLFKSIGGIIANAAAGGTKGLIKLGANIALLSGGVYAGLEAFQSYAEGSDLAEQALSMLGFGATDLEDRFNGLINETGLLDEEVVTATGSILDFLPTVEDASVALGTASISAGEMSKALDEVNKRIDPVGTALDDLALTNTLLKKEVEKGTIAQSEAEKIMKSLTREALGMDTTLDDLAEKQLKVEEAFKLGAISADEYQTAISNIKGEIIDYNAENTKTYGSGAIKGVKDYYEAISDNAKNATDFVAGAFSGLESSMSDFFYSGDLSFSTFVDAIKLGLADLAAKAVITTGINFLGKVFPNLSFADGGLIPGSGGPRSDDVLARVSSGEYVVKASSVSKFGTGFMDQINAGQMPSYGGSGVGGGGFGIDAGVMNNLTPGFLFGGLIKIIKKAFDRLKNLISGILDIVKKAIGYLSAAVTSLVNGIMSGDLMTIASVALPFILPGVGAAISANLAAGTGFAASVSGGISSSFAAGIMGAGNFSAMASSVAIQLGKSTFTNALSGAISDKIVGTTDGMASSGGAYEQDRATRFGRLYNNAAPYLAGMTGTSFRAGDNVRVGERGEEVLIPSRNGSVAPIKGSASDLIGAVNAMKDEIIMLRRQMSRVIAGGQLSGGRT
jgi:hypothetical protein